MRLDADVHPRDGLTLRYGGQQNLRDRRDVVRNGRHEETPALGHIITCPPRPKTRLFEAIAGLRRRELRLHSENQRRSSLTDRPTATVHDAVAEMAQRNIGALPVVSEGALGGIITEPDYARRIILQGRSSAQTAVREIM